MTVENLTDITPKDPLKNFWDTTDIRFRSRLLASPKFLDFVEKFAQVHGDAKTQDLVRNIRNGNGCAG